MKIIIAIILFGISNVTAFCQDNATSMVKIPNEEYAIYKYNPDLQMDILTYQYSDLWDIDNDNHNDTIEFISNGAAHSYYHLRVWLSSKNEWIAFPTLQIDFPYPPNKIKKIEELNELYPQFAVQDFDADNIKEIYLSFDEYSSIPIEYGVTSKKILIDYVEDKLMVIDFKNK